jgi:hypothetical protein
MEIKEFTFRLMLLGIPGISCYFLLKKLIGKIGADRIEAVLSIFVFSILCYLSVDILFWIASLVPSLAAQGQDGSFMRLKSLLGDLSKIDDAAILESTACSVPVAAVLAWLYRHKVWNRIGQGLRLTNRYGDEDVFNYLLGSELSAPGWYVVRDHKESLIYYGAITAWSDENEDRELLLAEVDVYSNQGEKSAQFLYKCANLYVCRNRDDISIELMPEKPEAKERPSSEQPINETKPDTS